MFMLVVVIIVENIFVYNNFKCNAPLDTTLMSLRDRGQSNIKLFYPSSEQYKGITWEDNFNLLYIG